jgi:hypothetical protein
MPRDRRGYSVVAVLKRLLVGVMLLAVAGCSSTQAGDRARWTDKATSADVVSARAGAERRADFIMARLPVKAATMASEDSCVVGTSDMWYTSQYQFSCHLDTVYYVPVDGALLPLLTEIDEAMRAAPLGFVPWESFENVQYYFAHGGKSSDGLQLSKPGLAYLTALGEVGVSWRDPAFPDPERSAMPTNYPMMWPQVYRAERSAVDLETLIPAHDNVLAISVSQTYFMVAWPPR